jgi:hypothetical protein
VHFGHGAQVHHGRAPLLLATAGGGVAGFGTQRATVIGNRVMTSNGFIGTLAGAVGGGADLRLSRLMSLRAEVRDFIGGPEVRARISDATSSSIVWAWASTGESGKI